MNKQIQMLLILLFMPLFIYAGSYEYKFRLTLSDKGESSYTVAKPENFLSRKAIERRAKQNIAIDDTDIPISEEYLKMIESTGGIIVAKSKWMKTVSVHCDDSTKIELFKNLPFVTNAELVWRVAKRVLPVDSLKVEDPIMKTTVIEPLPAEGNSSSVFDDYYGFAEQNIKIQNGHVLHQTGFKGEGIDIAVIDAGYNNFPRISLLDNVRVNDSKGFVYGRENIFHETSDHGLNVLSCMATNKPHVFVGTAPEANYILLATEDNRSEFPIEEDYWSTAIEYADSIGVDIVNTSLGYNKFDAPVIGHKRSELDGKTALITKAADMAVRKGMFVVCSAGNSGNSEWRTLTPPADANLVLTIGAVRRDSVIASFSSRGFTADLRVKPDVTALGQQAAVVGDNGYERLKNGTSFSSPIMCGLVACLWQAFPTLNNRELLQVVKQSADKYDMPDDSYGYGIPDMDKAMKLAQQLLENKQSRKKNIKRK